MSISPEMNRKIDELLAQNQPVVLSFEQALQIIEARMTPDGENSEILISDRKIPDELSKKIDNLLAK